MNLVLFTEFEKILFWYSFEHSKLALKSTQNGADKLNFPNLFTDYKKINYGPFSFVRFCSFLNKISSFILYHQNLIKMVPN
ncbi:hypothetical protein BpHYR1_028498 [Brachionus plicatilis]|uniref:Uncharacterized protein n=1 Tax=Brachionus plicatilis TaxID=10195 RepID=A0A3M7PI19_BRAPC|nr:hypothetical protein BpHYR1_028498 [Brachionus plicatilis]